MCAEHMWMPRAVGDSANGCKGYMCAAAVLAHGSWRTLCQELVIAFGVCSLMTQSLAVAHIRCKYCIPTHTRASRLSGLHLARIELATFSV